MIGKKMEKALNDQIKAEIDSAFLYLSMSSYFRSVNLDGMAKWMAVQYKEEMGHAMKLYEHVIDRGGRAKIPGVAEPKQEWKSPLDAFKAAYVHERKVTGLINNLVKLAAAEKDNPAAVLLNWYVEEQVEEEASTDKIVKLLDRLGDSGSGLIMLDVHLGKRGE